ncbi:MAG TPA: site-specific integrase [Streptosporangiaceae bacterium]|jgi:integrase
MANRRLRGEGGISFDHRGPCSDSERHRHCPGSWRAEVTLGFTSEGKRDRRRVKGRTKADVQEKLRELRGELDKGIIPKAGAATYTVQQAAEDWLREGLTGRSPKTVKKNENMLTPILKSIGGKKLRELTAADVSKALAAMAATYSSAAVAIGHNALTRTIRYAESRDLVARNVATLVDTPKGQVGRPSKSLTLKQAAALLRASGQDHAALDMHAGLKDRRRSPLLMHAYIVLSLTTGLRTEEIRALRWEHVDLKGSPRKRPPIPPHVSVWRSVRSHGDTKTESSRRTLELPEAAVEALRGWSKQQTGERQEAGAQWHDDDLVFTTVNGIALDAANVRRMFRAVCQAAGLGGDWTPRELRHSFVSVMSQAGMATEEIARLVGHSNSRTTEIVYRHELRPVIRSGAEIMNKVFH